MASVIFEGMGKATCGITAQVIIHADDTGAMTYDYARADDNNEAMMINPTVDQSALVKGAAQDKGNRILSNAGADFKTEA